MVCHMCILAYPPCSGGCKSTRRCIVFSVYISTLCELWVTAPARESLPCQRHAAVDLRSLHGQVLPQVRGSSWCKSSRRCIVFSLCISTMWELWVTTPARESVPCQRHAAVDLRSLLGQVLSQVRANPWSKSSRWCLVSRLCISALWELRSLTAKDAQWVPCAGHANMDVRGVQREQPHRGPKEKASQRLVAHASDASQRHMTFLP